MSALADFIAELGASAAEAFGWEFPWNLKTDINQSWIELQVIDHGMGPVPGFMWTREFIEDIPKSMWGESINTGIENIKGQMHVCD